MLATRRATLKRDMLLWRGFLTCVIGLALMVVLEAAILAGGIWLNGVAVVVRAQAPAVKKIETAQTLSTRIEEMTQRHLMPLEMLAVVNQNRPASITFTRSTTSGLNAMEIELTTANATDMDQYETVLRAAPELAGIESQFQGLREGISTYRLTVTFKPGALHQEAGS